MASVSSRDARVGSSGSRAAAGNNKAYGATGGAAAGGGRLPAYATPARHRAASMTRSQVNRRPGSALHATTSAPRITERLAAWNGYEGIIDQEHIGGLGVSQRHRDQGVLPPFTESEAVKGLAGQFLKMHRRKHVDTTAAMPSIHVTESSLVAVDPRPGSAPAWGEVWPPVGKRRVGDKIMNMASSEITETLAGEGLRAIPADVTSRLSEQRRVLEMMKGRQRDLPLASDAPAAPELAVPSAIQGKTVTGSWAEAFKRFPRELDGTVSVNNFVSTLQKMASDTPGRSAGLSQHDIDRVVRMVDPSGSGIVSFSNFSKAFSSATGTSAPATSLQVDGTGRVRTHTKAQQQESARSRLAAAQPSSDVDTVPDDVASAHSHGDADAPRVRLHDTAASEAGTAESHGEPHPDAASGVRALHRKDRAVVPTIRAVEAPLPADSRRLVQLSRNVLSRVTTMFGTQPSALRKLFLKFRRTADGTSSVSDIASGLRGMGVPGVQSRDVAAILGIPESIAAAEEMFQGVDAATPAQHEVGTSARVTFDHFAHALDTAATTGKPPAVGTAQTMALSSTEDTVTAADAEAAAPTVRVPVDAVLRVANAAHASRQMSSSRMLDVLTEPAVTSQQEQTAMGLGLSSVLAGTGVAGGYAARDAAAAARDVASEYVSAAERPPAGVISEHATGNEARLSGGRAAGQYARVYGNYAGGAASTLLGGASTLASGMRRTLNPEDVLKADALSKVRKHLDIIGKTPTQIFLKVDKQRDGTLTHGEVRSGLRQMGVRLSDDEFHRVLHLMDPQQRGEVDHKAFVAALFPPDTHPRTKAYPFERRARTRRGRVQLPKWGETPSYDLMRTEDDVGAAPRRDSGGGEDGLQLGDDTGSAAGAPGDGEDEGAAGPSWLDIPTVDAQGMFQTERDAGAEGVTTKSRRHFNMDRPAPYLHGTLQPRDTYGTPAPYLVPDDVVAAAKANARRGRRGSLDLKTTLALEHSLWAHGAAQNAHRRAASADVHLGKRQNAILRRVIDTLHSKGNARSLWLKLNNNHDGKADVGELREGLAKLGVHLSKDEFKLFMQRVDVDGSRSITFDEFSRAFKGDDPIPDDFYAPAPTTMRSSLASPTANAARDPVHDPVVHKLGYRMHRYEAAPDARGVSHDGVPRHQALDSRAAWLSIQGGGGGPAAAASSLEEARMQLEVVDRMHAKTKKGLHDVFRRLTGTHVEDAVQKGDAVLTTDAGTLPADPVQLRQRFLNAGITLSEKQVAAFLRPILDAAARASTDGARVDYPTFVALAQPRAFLDTSIMTQYGVDAGQLWEATRRGRGPVNLSSPTPAPVGQSRRLSVDTGARPLLGYSEAEGIGKFGLIPDREPRPMDMPVTTADFVRKTNTPATGISWDALAVRSAQAPGVHASETGSVRDETHTGGGEDGKVALAVAADAEWQGLPTAGRLMLSRARKGRLAQQEIRSAAADHVSALVHGYSIDGTDTEPAPILEAAPEPTAASSRRMSATGTYAHLGIKQENAALAEDVPGTYLSAARAATAWVVKPQDGAADAGDAAGITTAHQRHAARRSQSVAPISRRAHVQTVRDRTKSHGVAQSLQWDASRDGSLHTSAAGALETGSALQRRGRSTPAETTSEDIPAAGVPTERQAMAVAASTAIMADEHKSRKREVHGTADHASGGTVLTYNEYPEGDPRLLQETRIKVKHRVVPPEALTALQRGMISATESRRRASIEPGSTAQSIERAAQQDASWDVSGSRVRQDAVHISPRHRRSIASDAPRESERARRTSVGALLDWGVQPSPAGISSPRQIHHVRDSVVSGQRSEKRHDHGSRSRHFDSSAFAGLGPA